MNDMRVWGIFVAEASSRFPNFFPIGLYSSKERALEELHALPKDRNYQLLHMPMDRNFAYYHQKTGKLAGMKDIDHEHFHFLEDAERG